METEDVDYLVIGAGSAGAVVAARLSEDADVRIMLLEAGPVDESPILHVPAAARYAFNARRFNWNYETEPEPDLGGRTILQPRGKVLGGSSSINGLIYLRGNALDFEAWAAEGAVGWGYGDVLPYFKKLENVAGATNAYQGRGGPVNISMPTPVNPIAAAFLQAGEQAGYNLTDDINGYCQEGFGRFPMNAAGGYRSSTARAYLQDARLRPNLMIHTLINVDKLVFENNRAVAAIYRNDGRRHRVNVRREIIVSAGAFNSPKLLKLSGVGPAIELKGHGIEIVHDLPGVGNNLMDHQISTVQSRCLQPVSLSRHLGLSARAMGALRWFFKKDGVLASNHFECGAFIRSAAGVKFPDIQLYLFPIAVKEGSKDFEKHHGFQIQLSAQRSLSRGWVHLRSSDPTDLPRIRFNFMSEERDWMEMRQAFRLAREILAQPAMDPFRGEEFAPGAAVRSDTQIDDYLRRNMHSSYHPCGTCKMGSDPMAVVDAQCRVHGLDGIRVVDASVMPRIPSSNLNAPTMMIGERVSDLIRGRNLAPEHLDHYVDKDWQTRQRPRSPLRKTD